MTENVSLAAVLLFLIALPSLYAHVEGICTYGFSSGG
jgi:hypothetical protein